MTVETSRKRKRELPAVTAPIKRASLKAVSTDTKPVNGTKTTKSGIVPKKNGETVSVETPYDQPIHIQVITGSYERVLHGIVATIPSSNLDRQPSNSSSNPITFSDSFLFAAHSSAVRCLAVSPSTEASKRYLATGSSDERINVYSLSTVPPSASTNPKLPSLTGSAITENPLNRALGSLIHHDRAITCLHFPGKSKLFSGAEDATIAISRTRDWTVLSSIKAPIPKPVGRPSGDTAGPGEVPAGVNGFAIHPSQKLMVSIGRGERCMRLWNLMTGKKAGVLNFEREVLGLVGEGKFSSGEGRSVVWDEEGENFVVGFERGAVVFGIDSKPKAIVRPTPSSKIHRMRFVSWSDGTSLLAVSTEDGRAVLYDISDIAQAETTTLPSCNPVAQLGGLAAGVTGRTKDFDIIHLPGSKQTSSTPPVLFVTGSSDGAVRLWAVWSDEIQSSEQAPTQSPTNGASTIAKQVGRLVATLETGNRITCLASFVLDGTTNAASAEDDALFEDGSQSEGEDGEEED